MVVTVSIGPVNYNYVINVLFQDLGPSDLPLSTKRPRTTTRSKYYLAQVLKNISFKATDYQIDIHGSKHFLCRIICSPRKRDDVARYTVAKHRVRDIFCSLLDLTGLRSKHRLGVTSKLRNFFDLGSQTA